MSVALHYRVFGEAQSTRPTVLLLHGLFGSGGNWQRIARRLEDRWTVLVPDLRNHGRSPHAPGMSYPEMASDLAGLLDRLGIDSAMVVGHSMGGKAAMQLALDAPDRVSRLVPVDIAPVTYPERFGQVIEALSGIDLSRLGQRSEADAELANSLDSEAVRQYLLQNLVRVDGHWAWRFNLDALAARVAELAAFPVHEGAYPGPALFVHGADSDYVLPEHRDSILARFPRMQLHAVDGAGHWVYSEQPEAFVRVLEQFLA
jgi:esterase